MITTSLYQTAIVLMMASVIILSMFIAWITMRYVRTCNDVTRLTIQNMELKSIIDRYKKAEELTELIENNDFKMEGDDGKAVQEEKNG